MDINKKIEDIIIKLNKIDSIENRIMKIEETLTKLEDILILDKMDKSLNRKELKNETFDLNENILKNYLELRNINSDLNLIKLIYLNKNNPIIISNNQKELLFWFDKKWNNDDNYLINTLVKNIYTNYLIINKYKNDNLNDFFENQKYIFTINQDKYKSNLLNLLKKNI